MVIVHDDAPPRGHWKLGKNSGGVRWKGWLASKCPYEVSHEGSTAHPPQETLQLLYPLEVHHDEYLPNPQVVPEPETVPGAVPQPKKSQVVPEPESVPGVVPEP